MVALLRNSLAVAILIAGASLPGTGVAAATAVDINGGTSWTGWTSKGFSNQLGVYASGSTTIIYEIYTTGFVFNNHAKTSGTTGGGPTGGTTGFGTGTFTNGAFANGNKMFGIGVRLVSGGTLGNLNNLSAVKFDLDGADYRAASSVGGTDGKVEILTYSQTGDFRIQTDTGTGSTVRFQVQPGNGSFYGGPNTLQTLDSSAVGGSGGDWPWRMFVTSNSYQWIFDLTAMKSLYGSSRPGFAGIGDVTNDSVIAFSGAGTNQVVLDGPVPEPATWSMLIVGFGLAGVAMRRKRGAAASAA